MSDPKYKQVKQKYLELTWINPHTFYISGQSHREHNFGKNDGYFLASNGVLLYSAAFPELYYKEETDFGLIDLCLACWGYSTKEDGKLLEVNNYSERMLLMEAVKEYNQIFCNFYLEDELFEI